MFGGAGLLPEALGNALPGLAQSVLDLVRQRFRPVPVERLDHALQLVLNLILRLLGDGAHLLALRLLGPGNPGLVAFGVGLHGARGRRDKPQRYAGELGPVGRAVQLGAAGGRGRLHRGFLLCQDRRDRVGAVHVLPDLHLGLAGGGTQGAVDVLAGLLDIGRSLLGARRPGLVARQRNGVELARIRYRGDGPLGFFEATSVGRLELRIGLLQLGGPLQQMLVHLGHHRGADGVEVGADLLAVVPDRVDLLVRGPGQLEPRLHDRGPHGRDGAADESRHFAREGLDGVAVVARQHVDLQHDVALGVARRFRDALHGRGDDGVVHLGQRSGARLDLAAPAHHLARRCRHSRRQDRREARHRQNRKRRFGRLGRRMRLTGCARRDLGGAAMGGCAGMGRRMAPLGRVAAPRLRPRSRCAAQIGRASGRGLGAGLPRRTTACGTSGRGGLGARLGLGGLRRRSLRRRDRRPRGLAQASHALRRARHQGPLTSGHTIRNGFGSHTQRSPSQASPS